MKATKKAKVKKQQVKLGFKPKQSTKKLMKDLKERDKYVLENRFGLVNEEKRTLESIGQEYDITRERVRQIQNAALKAIRKSDNYEEAKDIFVEIENLIKELGGVVSEEHFLNHISPDGIVQNHIHFHLVVGENFKKHKEDDTFRARWSVDGELADKVHDALEKLHKDLTEDEIIAEEKLILDFLDRLDGVQDGMVDAEIARQFLNISKILGKNPLGDWGLSSSKNITVRGIRDYAYLVMKKNGSPMHFREVAEAIEETFGKKANAATTHNELIKDDRFVLVGRGMYGLKEWGYKEGVVKDVIADMLFHNGPMTKEEIIEGVLRERYLKKNTILVNLSNKDYFIKNNKGQYELTDKMMKKLKKKNA